MRRPSSGDGTSTIPTCWSATLLWKAWTGRSESGEDKCLSEAMQTLRVATYNIHKGLSFLNRRLVIHELRERLRTLHPDLVFLQEVHGAHNQHAARFENWPTEPQYEFLADTVWN